MSNTENERLKTLLRAVSEAINNVLIRFDGSDKHNKVLVPLCNIGIEIDEVLAENLLLNADIKPSPAKPFICHKHG